MIKKMCAVLVSAILSLSMVITSNAAMIQIQLTDQDKMNASGMIGSCDCEYCGMIDMFFQNEQDPVRRELSVQVWKASIHPELFVDCDGAVYVGTYPNPESLRFITPTLGLDHGWPRMRESGGMLKVYMPRCKGPEIGELKQSVRLVMESVHEMNTLAEGQDTYEKLKTFWYYCNGRFEYSDDLIQGYVPAKLSVCLKYSKACCTGYSTLFKIACNMNGIPATYVGNDSHMFVGIQYEGQERYVDATMRPDQWGEDFFLFGSDKLTDVHTLTKR